jgi:hypothetical protein
VLLGETSARFTMNSRADEQASDEMLVKNGDDGLAD